MASLDDRATDFVPGSRFWEEETEWEVAEVGLMLPENYQRSKLCVFYFSVEAYPDGAPGIDECEWTPIEELRDLVFVAQNVSSRFQPTLQSRARAMKTHPLMLERRADAGWQDVVLGEQARHALDKAYAARNSAMKEDAKKVATFVIVDQVLDLFGIILAKIQDLIKVSYACTGRKRKREPDKPDFLKEATFSVPSMKLVRWMEHLMVMAGFVEIGSGVFEPGRPDAVKRLFGQESNKSFSNALLVPDYFEKDVIERANKRLPPDEKIPTDLINPFKANEKVIYDVGVRELGDRARDSRDERNRLFPSYMLRHMLVDKMVGATIADPRLRHFTYVKDDHKFEIKIKPIALRSYAAYGGVPHEAGAQVTISFAFQRAFRKTPGRTPMTAVFPSLLSPSSPSACARED